MEDIKLAKNELYRSIRNHDEVVGASTRSNNEGSYIVILLSTLTDKIKSVIPDQFKNHKVIYEVIGEIE